MGTMTVTWVGGTWFIQTPRGAEPVRGGSKDLDAWLARHQATRADLDFGGSRALEQRFVNDFGPIASR
jgi:hypothetical protein